MPRITGTLLLMSARDMQQLMQKYKLNTSMTPAMLMMIRNELQTVLEPVIDFSCDEAHLWAAVSLGEGADRYLHELQAQGLSLKAYAADCLMLEYMLILYQKLESELSQSNLYVRDYHFPDPTSERDMMTEIIMRTGTDIALREEGMMHPEKSAVYLCRLADHPVSETCGGHICSSCGNRDCSMRIRIPWSLKSVIGDPGMVRYGYGYKSIFGQDK